MSATYSSFDTLTIDTLQGEATPGGPMLPVLAAIPAIGPQAKPEPPVEPVNQPVEPPPAPVVRSESAHAAEVAPPRFQTAEPVQTIGKAIPLEAPTPEAEAPAAAPVPQPHYQPAPPAYSEPTSQSSEDEWHESSWAAQLLALETTLRPHARLILLAALIAITGLLLVVLRSPVEVLPESLPSNMVDSNETPSLNEVEGAVMVAADAGSSAPRLDPLPVMPSVTAPAESMAPTATVTAAGPAGMRVNLAPADITPVEPHRTASAEVEPAATAEQPKVRVAQVPAYPTTSYPAPSWQVESSTAPPHAQLQRPTKPSTTGMQQ